MATKKNHRMKSTPEERAEARAESLRAGRIVLQQLYDSLLDEQRDALDLNEGDVQDIGRVDRLMEYRDALEEALELSPARAAAAIERLKRDCQELTEELERHNEANPEDDISPNPYDWGAWEAEFDIRSLWPAPLKPARGQVRWTDEDARCPQCNVLIERENMLLHIGSDILVCPACYRCE